MEPAVKYFSPVSPTNYGFASFVLITIGLFLTALFCVYNNHFL